MSKGNSGLLSKFQTKIPITGTGDINIEDIEVLTEVSVRVLVKEVDISNSITVSARLLNDKEWIVIDTLYGTANDIINVSTWDYIKFTCTNYVSAGDPYLVASGFFNTPAGTGQQPDGDIVNLKADGLATDVSGTSVLTDTPLGSSATYTSGWVDSDGFKSIEITIMADQLSATNGILVEYTSDANEVTPTVDVSKSFTFSDSDLNNLDLTIAIPPRLDGFRISYTNSSIAQSVFLLSVVLRTAAIQEVSIPLESTLIGSTNATVSKNVIAAKNDLGAYENTSLSDDGGLRVSLVESETEIQVESLTSWSTNQSNVGTTAVQIVGSVITDRKSVIIKNLASSGKIVYIGTSAAVNSSTGYELATGEAVEITLNPLANQIWAISASGTQRVCWLQVGD